MDSPAFLSNKKLNIWEFLKCASWNVPGYATRFLKHSYMMTTWQNIVFINVNLPLKQVGIYRHNFLILYFKMFWIFSFMSTVIWEGTSSYLSWEMWFMCVYFWHHTCCVGFVRPCWCFFQYIGTWNAHFYYRILLSVLYEIFIASGSWIFIVFIRMNVIWYNLITVELLWLIP